MNRIDRSQANHLPPLAAMLLFLTSASPGATGLPEQWVEEALEGADEGVHLIIKNHMESQLDWRSYYQDRIQTRRRLAPPEGDSRSSVPPSPTGRSLYATGDDPVCPGDRPGPGGGNTATRNCAASTI